MISRSKNSKPRTLLQSIAIQRNWFKWFICRELDTGCLRHLKLSEATRAKIERINWEMRELREMVDQDWKIQRKKIKEDQNRKNTEQIINLGKQHINKVP